MRLLRSEAIALIGVSVAAGLLLAFAAIADEMQEGPGRAFDQAILQALHPGPDLRDPVGPAWLDRAVADLTDLGSVAVLVVVVLIGAGFLLLRGQRLKALELAVSLVGGIAISQTLKSVFERTRPPDAYRAAEVFNASFPSGHALLATVVYLALGTMLARAMARRRLRFYILGVAIALALIVGFSRIYLGVHWASDVLAGWCIGAAWATACWLGGYGAERWLSARGQPANDG